MKQFLRLLIMGIVIGVVLLLMQFGFMVASGDEILFNQKLLTSFGYHQFYSIAITLGNGYYYDFLTKNDLWNKYKKYRIIIGAIGAVIITMFLIFFIRAVLSLGVDGKSWQQFISDESISNYLFSLLITIVISVFFHAAYFYRELQKNKIDEQKVIAGTATAQFDALKNQLDPHFLFNSLNVLTSLIDENPKNAQKFTTSLSKVYRYVLEQKSKELVTVDDELKFAKTYVSLLKMRFEDSIIFDIPEQISNPEGKVVPLSLQLLLENAVKHNIVTESNPLNIKIYEENGTLIIKNNLQPKQVIKKGSGVGLQNIKQRYNLLTNRKVEIGKTASDFIVKIPMLTKQSSIMKTETINQDNKYARARKRVDELKEFYSNIGMYTLMVPFFIFINYKTYWDFKWFWFPMAGWGVGILFHAYKVYVGSGFMGRNWEERKIREYMEENQNNTHWE